jgi:hypothetical protein
METLKMSEYTTSVTLIDDDDEFGGLMVNINDLKAKCEPNDEDDEFGGLMVDINDLKDKCESIDRSITELPRTPNKILATTIEDILELPEGWDKIGFDTEYHAQTDKKTSPFCISLYSAGNFGEYLHPDSHPARIQPVMVDVKRKLRTLAELQSLRVFKTPFVILDFLNDTYGIQWRPIRDLKRKRVKTIKMYFFFSFKDLQFLWAKDSEFLYYCLQYLERIRRITTKFNKPIALPYEILLPSKKGNKWNALAIELVDICAMQGNKGLKTYLQNVGLPTDEKTVWDWNKDNNPLNFFIQKPNDFIKYIRGDVKYLKTVHDKTIEFYNDIAATVGVEPSDNWGLSTGKITARIASEWLASRSNVMLPTDEENEKKVKPLYWYNRLASPEAMKNLSHVVGNQALLYLGMTDGGRCVKERSTIDILDGVLVDIDINGCYGNGLKNQIFPIGNPSILALPMNFKEWEDTYSKYLIPGLWVARISWKDAPFKQDLLISKEEKSFTAWEWYQSHFSENNSDTDKQYDASMYLSTNQVHMAAFTHDLYQVILNYGSDKIELPWIRENAVIECFAYYDKRDEIEQVIPEMCEMKSIKEMSVSGLVWCTKWVRVELKDLAGKLINRRSNHKGKMKMYTTHFGKDNKDAKIEDVPEFIVIGDNEFTKADFLYQNSVQEFIKLIVNTIYGCIASSYFAGDGTGISNFIIGNNITARARVLAWCMAKGLFSLMSITDGGVFDVNKVAFYRCKSLNIFTQLGFENFKRSNGQMVVDIKPLYGFEVEKKQTMFSILNKNNHVEKLAWEHLKNQFGELDIFKFDQYSFEVKKIYTDCQIRNKSDYRLHNSVNGELLTKIRGLSKKSCQDGDEIPDNIELTEDNVNDYGGSADKVVKAIFDDISNGENNIWNLKGKRLLGLAEWRELNSEERKTITPHDEISDVKKFYSFTPLGCKFINSKHRKDVMRLYEMLKQWERPELMEQLRLLENVTDVEEYKRVKNMIKHT